MNHWKKKSIVGLSALVIAVVMTVSAVAVAASTRVEIVNACTVAHTNITVEYTQGGAPKTAVLSLAVKAKTSITADRGTRVLAKYGNNKTKSVPANGGFTRLALTD